MTATNDNNSGYRPLLHWTAVVTACLSLLPISVGALVTTLDAGMAFADWPSSDGQNMFLYPWLGSFGEKDKFIEHGHRLAGALIGMVSIALVVIALRTESRRWVKGVAIGVLLAVIAQGILGGTRVLANDPRFAMLHGLFAAMVFSLMASLALFTSRTWLERPQPSAGANVGALKVVSVVLPLLILGQYIMGGMLRHLGMVPFEHMMFAVVVLFGVIAATVVATRTRDSWLRRPAWMLGLLVLVQFGLGLGTWITKFGLAATGYVAVHHSSEQIIVHSAHTVTGMLLLMTSIVLALRAFRTGGLTRPALPAMTSPGMQPIGGAR